ncbi:MAG TPA: carboxymuconolactone decarboxylase family protein [Burkholderiales bacterium]|nr:carboxymuconolactone decarboxylase family protein [Burkholderiales bacterium]
MAKTRSALAAKGEALRRKIYGDAHVDKSYRDADEFMMMFQDLTDEFCWGLIWSRPGLDHKTRALLSLAMTAAQSQAGAVKMHAKTCLRAGWTKAEIGEALLHAYCYAGAYASLSSFLAAKEAFDEVERANGAAGKQRGRAEGRR